MFLLQAAAEKSLCVNQPLKPERHANTKFLCRMKTLMSGGITEDSALFLFGFSWKKNFLLLYFILFVFTKKERKKERTEEDKKCAPLLHFFSNAALNQDNQRKRRNNDIDHLDSLELWLQAVTL